MLIRREAMTDVGREGNRQAPPIDAPVRLNKYIASCGIASRRKADELIGGGLVRVNGVVVTAMGTTVGPGDEVVVNGRTVSPRKLDYILLNKPRNAITTTRDDRGRATVMDLVSEAGGEGSGLFPVGRLDRNTTGALLVTNDGDLANRLMHPRYEVPKVYVVSAAREFSDADLDALRSGIELEDGLFLARHVAYVDPGDRTTVALEIHEGRNRIVRRAVEALEHEVTALDRRQYGFLTLAGLRRGRWRRLSEKEISRLRRSAGLKAGNMDPSG